MPLYHPAELPVEAIQKVVAGVRAGDYLSTETVDAALQVGGCVNALRGPLPFGAAGDESGLSDDELCDRVEAEMPAFGASAGAEAIPPFLVPILVELIGRVLLRFIGKSSD